MTVELYHAKYFSGSKKFQKNKSRLKEIADIVCSFEPKKVLDVGCGLGYLVRELRDRGIETYGSDFAVDLWKQKWLDYNIFYHADAKQLPWPNQTFDVVVSSDFFEHIPEQDIDQVFSEMKRVGKKVIARIAYEDVLTPKQALYHCTNKPKEWWINKLPECQII